MMKLSAALVVALSLAGCATFSPVQTPEKVDTDAADAYLAVDRIVSSYEEGPGADKAKAETLRVKAWSFFVLEHNAYQYGRTYDIKPLLALVKEAGAL